MEIKKWFKVLFALVINVLGDMANGIILMTIVSKALNVEAPWYFYLPAALPFIGFSCLPDIDFIFTILFGKRMEEHKSLSHLPLLMMVVVPAITCFACFLVGADILFWFYVSLFGLLSHYLKDSIGRDVDTGIKWLWPLRQFKNRRMKFFTLEKRKRHLVYVFSEEESKKPMHDMHEWARRFYWGLKCELVLNVGIFIIAVILAIFW